MRLADFIEANTEPILAEWESFAATCGPAAKTMSRAALRDHALPMLRNIVKDLRTPQKPIEQADKSKGVAAPPADALETAAETHGADRAESGFTIGEMVSEYRALRASVIRLWTKSTGTLSGVLLDDLLRFSEAIDLAAAESVTRYTVDIAHSRERFLAILGHDLRTPLGAIMTSAQAMLETGFLAEPSLSMTNRIVRSTRRMSDMVGDLLDFTRGRLGSGIPVEREHMDMAQLVRQVVDETAAAHPKRELRCTTKGDLRGSWDGARMAQVLTNLIGNAVQYGSLDAPISVAADGETSEVVLRVHNRGPVVASSDLREIFSPLRRLATEESEPDSNSLGLGLYIAERIVTAHGGMIDVTSSSDAGTTFTVRLPR